MTIGREAWEARAQGSVDELRQVLFQNWPPALNRLLHRWHVSLLERALDDLPDDGLRVLDVGCGPGRLARELAAKSSVAHIRGVDHAPTFLEAFRTATAPKGEAVVADLAEECISGGPFDLAVLVASLMYVPPDGQARVLSNILASLRPGGRLLVVENDATGVRAATWWGLLRRGVGRASADHLFRPGELASLLSSTGSRILWRAGLPLATLPMPALWGVARVAPPLVRLLDPVWRVTGGWPGPTIQTALLVAPAEGQP